MKIFNLKKVIPIFLVSILLAGNKINAQGFATTPIFFGLPSGGANNGSGHTSGFYETYGTVTYYNNSQAWSTMDMDGDGKPDLVVTEQGNGTYGDCFGIGSNPYWKVYLNNGTGYATTPVFWALPAGGLIISGHNYGFNVTTGSYANQNGSQAWSTMDMDGDGKPDLVVTEQGNGTYGDCFGIGSSPYWKVYLNTGNGFATTPVFWALPTGGSIVSGHNYGFYLPYGSATYDNGSQAWSTMDMDGDMRPDLVVTEQGNGTYGDCFGIGSSPYWKVYLNTGNGFATTPIFWALPAGGSIVSGHNYGFYLTYGSATYDNGSQAWSTMDMDGDNKVDLVVTEQGNGTYGDCFGVSSNPYWKVYLNNGSGYATTPIFWALPAGGYITSGHNYGFYLTSGSPNYENNSVAWSVMDIDGDHKSDLIVTAQGDGSHADCYGIGSSPYWKVYFNNGNGYATTPVFWALPSGGYVSSSHDFGFYMTAGSSNYEANSQGWTVMDMDGNSVVDLVVTSQGNGTYSDCFGVGSTPYWKVFMNTTVVTPTLTTNIKEETNKVVEVLVYPNPFTEKLSIKTQGSSMHTPFVVTDISGKRIMEGKIESEFTEVDLGNLKTGLYFIEVKGRNFKIMKE